MRRTNVPSLLEEYPKEEDDEERSCPEPSIRRKWGRFVEVCLIYLKQKVSAPTPQSFTQRSHTR
jgi:hypothetical protein